MTCDTATLSPPTFTAHATYLRLEVWGTGGLGLGAAAARLVSKYLHVDLLVPQLRAQEGGLQGRGLIPVVQVSHLVLSLLLLGGQPVHLAQQVLEVEARPGQRVSVVVSVDVGHLLSNCGHTREQNHVW